MSLKSIFWDEMTTVYHVVLVWDSSQRRLDKEEIDTTIQEEKLDRWDMKEWRDGIMMLKMTLKGTTDIIVTSYWMQ